MFTISFNGVTMPVVYDGEPGGIFKECIPVVVHGVIENGELLGDRVEVKHSDEYVAVNDERRARGRTGRLHRFHDHTVMLVAASVNSALGRAGLLLMLAACVFGALAVLYGIRRNDKRLLRQGPTYALFALGGIVLAVVMMQRALITRDFSMAYIQQVGSADTPLLYNIAAMWSALEGSILLWALMLGIFTAAVAWRFRDRTDDVLVGWALIVMFVISAFFAMLSFGPADPFAAGAAGVTSGPGPNPLLQNHILVLFHPPILYLGYVGFTRAVRLRDRRAGHGTPRRGLAHGDPSLGVVLVGVPHDRHPARWMVELRGARLVGRVGMGSRRERVVPALADRHGVHPLGARPGATRHAARLEPEPARRDVRAHDPRDVPHPVGRAELRARLRRRPGRAPGCSCSSASSWSCRSG